MTGASRIILLSIFICTLMAQAYYDFNHKAQNQFPLAFAAKQMLASVWQSCAVLEPGLNGTYERADSTDRSYLSCQLEIPSPKYFLDHVDIERRRFTIYKEGSENLLAYLHDNTSDCSSFVSGIVASSGLRFKKGKDPGNGYQPGTSMINSWGSKADDCFAPVVFDGIKSPLQPGDIINSGGEHVVIVSNVFDILDPLDFEKDGIRSESECEQIPSNKKLGTLIQSLGPAFQSHFSVVDFEYTGGYSFYREACLAHVKQMRGEKPHIAAVKGRLKLLRHKGTPACKAERKINPLGYQCVSSCPQLVK